MEAVQEQFNKHTKLGPDALYLEQLKFWGEYMFFIEKMSIRSMRGVFRGSLSKTI